MPKDTPGITVVRNQRVFGSLHSPGGEAELKFENVRVPKGNLILGEGRGFEIAQGRLGPGRIHHCMRSIGQAQRALEIMARRVESRVAFGKKLVRPVEHPAGHGQGLLRGRDGAAADAQGRRPDGQGRQQGRQGPDRRDQGRRAADGADGGDRAIQSHGGMGVSDDTPLAEFFTLNRFLRIADGPDEVHMSQLGKQKIREYVAMNAR